MFALLVLLGLTAAVWAAALVGRARTPYYWAADDTPIASHLSATSDAPSGNCVGSTMPNGLLAVLGSVWHRPSTGGTWDCLSTETAGESAWKARGVAAPAGPTTAIQTNAGGVLGGSANLTWDDALQTGGASGTWNATTLRQDGNPVVAIGGTSPCTAGQIPKTSGGNFVCADDDTGGSGLAPTLIQTDLNTTHTGTTTETVLATKTIPANTLTAGRKIEFEVVAAVPTQGTTASTLRVRLGGLGGSQIAGVARTTTGDIWLKGFLVANSLTSQTTFYRATTVSGGTPSSSSTATSTTVNMGVDQAIVITLNLGATSDSWTIRNASITLQVAPDETLGGGGGGSGDITAVGNCSTGDCFQSAAANTVLAAPNGTSGVAQMRTLVAADIPSLDASKVTTGVFNAARVVNSPANSRCLRTDASGNVTVAATDCGAGGSLTVREQDLTPDVAGVTTIEVSNGTLTDLGSGVVRIATGGGGGGTTRQTERRLGLPLAGSECVTQPGALLNNIYEPVITGCIAGSAGVTVFTLHGWNASAPITAIAEVWANTSNDVIGLDFSAHCVRPGVDSPPNPNFASNVFATGTITLNSTLVRGRSASLTAINGTCNSTALLYLAWRISSGSSIAQPLGNYLLGFRVEYSQ